jgi:hypothetical protein
MAPQPETDHPKYMVTEEMLHARNWYRRQGPFYRAEEVAKFFFGMSASWLRLKWSPDADHPETWFVQDGKRMVFRRSNPGKGVSARVFFLSDIEPMAYSLHRFGAISGARLARILTIVQAQAALYGLFDEPVTTPGDDESDELADSEPDTEPADA